MVDHLPDLAAPESRRRARPCSNVSCSCGNRDAPARSDRAARARGPDRISDLRAGGTSISAAIANILPSTLKTMSSGPKGVSSVAAGLLKQYSRKALDIHSDMPAISARDPHQLQARSTSCFAPYQKADPARSRENVMSRTPFASLHHPVAVRFPDKASNKPLPCRWPHSFPEKKNPTPPRRCTLGRLREVARVNFHVADRAETRPIKESRRPQQHRIEDLRRARNGASHLSLRTTKSKITDPMVDRRQIGDRRAVQDFAERIETGSVARAIPRRLHPVPVHDAFKCGQTAVIS